jgi:hypothetical protein
VVGIAAVLLAGLTTACSTASTPGTAPAQRPAAPSIAVPLATSIHTAAGTWAAVAMGHLDDPLNTFWQLFYRPAGAVEWSNQVGATAVATNGGLVLAANGGRTLVVGVRPTNLLTFSPLLATSNGGRSWSNGLSPGGLARRPYALATGPSGQGLALVDSHGVAQVLASPTGLTGWAPLVTEAGLAGSSCGLRALTAVGYLGTGAVVAGACDRPGVVGLFSSTAGGWTLIGPSLPSQLAGGRVEVLALLAAGAGLRVLLAVAAPTGTSLLGAWTPGPGRAWTTSPPLPLTASQTLVSVGPDSGDGMFVLVSGASGRENLYVVHGPGQSWGALPAPPPGTATVAFQPDRTTDALAVNDTLLTVSTAGPHSSGWTKSQTLNVDIPFGSSG